MSSIHTLASYIPLWIQVTRLDRPIGWIVLLWPTWIALTVAGYAAAEFRLDIWVIFTLGVIITAAPGCVVNDLTDRKFDRHVKRTRTRPITSGNLSVKNGVVLAIVLFSVCLGLVLMTNRETIKLSFIALGFAVVYPWLEAGHVLAADRARARVFDGDTDGVYRLRPTARQSRLGTVLG